METVAEIVADAFSGLGNPPHFLFHPKDAVRIIRRRLAFYSVKQLQGDQQSPLAVKEVNYATNDILLSDVTSPDWVERRITANNVYGNEGWEYVPTVNIDSLEEWRGELRPAVAFYFDSGNNLRMRLSQLWADNTNLSYRVWHTPHSSPLSNLEDTVNLPPNFTFMLSADVRARAIPIMMAKAGGLDYDVPEMTQLAWANIQKEAQSELQEWQELFDESRNRSLGGRKGRNRRPVLRSTWGNY